MVEALAAWPGAALLRSSPTLYLVVNAAHILGLALLVGAILPLDLRLLGLWRSVSLGALAPVLVRSAALGAALALATGFWLFTVRPAEYLANPAFLAKLAILVLAFANVGLQHRGGFGRAAAARDGSVPGPVRIRAGVSLLAWLGAVLAGRWIGFA